MPLTDNDQTREDPFPPPLQGADTRFWPGNIEIPPIGLSWQLAPGIVASAGFSIFAPTGDFDPDQAIDTGADFWTFAPSFGFSNPREGWTLSANA